jgi:hypothetical protein
MCIVSVCVLALARIASAATGTVTYQGEGTEKADTLKPPASLASFPAPAAAGKPLHIVLVDEDWSDNNAAGGGDAASWSVEIVETYKNGPAFERLRESALVP